MEKSQDPQNGNQPVFPKGSLNAGMNEKRITSLEIAAIAGKSHAYVLKAIRKMEMSWKEVAEVNFDLGCYLDGNGQERPCYRLTKRESLYIATKFNDKARAKLVLRWEELETKHHKQEPPKVEDGEFDMKLKWLEFLPGYLNLSDVSKLSLAKKIAEPLGLPVPDYVSAPNGAKHSATELLKMHEVDMSARQFNELATQVGLLVQKERKGTAKVHKFYVITGKGLSYGENDINEKCPTQTQHIGMTISLAKS